MAVPKSRAAIESLPRTIFTHRAETLFKQFSTRLGPHCDNAFLANLTLEYLRLGNKIVKVRSAQGIMKFLAIDIAQNFRPPFTGPNFEVIGNADFEQSAAVLITDENFSLVASLVHEARTQASELNLPWRIAAPLFEASLGNFLHDTRPKPVRRGAIREKVIYELETIRSSPKKWETYDEFKACFRDFKIIEIISAPCFDDEDRELLMTPSQWETKPTTHCNGLLKKYWKVSEETVKSYRKQHNRAKKTPRRARK